MDLRPKSPRTRSPASSTSFPCPRMLHSPMHFSRDKAKLLLLGLLRTVSALAATETSPRAVGALPLTIRLARTSDVPGIQRCNLATLPENYNQAFYNNHLRQWPELAIVACVENDNEPGSIFRDSSDTVVAYVLGKIEERTVYEPYDVNVDPIRRFNTERIGHVTSLAVLEPFRRQGLANALLHQLHYHLAHCYRTQAVGLHVRQSNDGACELYKRWGYNIDEVIPRYYQDGEDAFFMKKGLEVDPSRGSPTLQRNWWRVKRPWEGAADKFRLPRIMGAEPAPVDDELLTGSM